MSFKDKVKAITKKYHEDQLELLKEEGVLENYLNALKALNEKKIPNSKDMSVLYAYISLPIILQLVNHNIMMERKLIL